MGLQLEFQCNDQNLHLATFAGSNRATMGLSSFSKVAVLNNNNTSNDNNNNNCSNNDNTNDLLHRQLLLNCPIDTIRAYPRLVLL